MTRTELQKEVDKNGHLIYVRAQVEGVWQSVPFSTLQPVDKEYYMDLWMVRQTMPLKLKEDKEI